MEINFNSKRKKKLLNVQFRLNFVQFPFRIQGELFNPVYTPLTCDHRRIVVYVAMLDRLVDEF